MTQSTTMTSTTSHGARVAPTEGKTLPLKSAALRVEARAGLARVILEQRFENSHAEALTVTYKLPLPADAVVSGFAFTLGDRRIVGEVDKKQAARERFEEALVQGKSAALLDEETSSLFTQEIGNIPPGATVVAEIILDQPLTFLAEGAWELRFPLAAAPRYLGSQASALGNVVIDVASGSIAPRASLDMTIGDELAEGRSPESPSHPLQCVASRGGGFKVELGSQNRAELDRDLVVRWPVARLVPKVELVLAHPLASQASSDSDEKFADRAVQSLFALCTLVPPEAQKERASVKRDLTLLIDTSGSMQGEPLAQAKRVACLLVQSLGDDDTVEIMEFSFTTSSFRNAPVGATSKNKVEAEKWINALEASGGTEMMTGIQAAMRDLRPHSQRQIVLITDGLVGFEREVVGALIAGLPASSRFHALGVGAAANRSLLMPIARAGRGVEAILGIGEDPERAANRLLSRMRDPLVVNLTVSGSALLRSAPERLPDLLPGAPARIALELKREGGDLTIRGRMHDGEYVWKTTVLPEEARPSEAVVKLYARERVEDLEARIAGGESKSLLDREIEELGLRFSISTRLTSWVAISHESSVDPRDPTRRTVMPQALPFAMSAEGLGLRGTSTGMIGVGGGMLPPIGAKAYGFASPSPAAYGSRSGRARMASVSPARPSRSAAAPMPPQAAPAMGAPMRAKESVADHLGAPGSPPAESDLTGREAQSSLSESEAARSVPILPQGFISRVVEKVRKVFQPSEGGRTQRSVLGRIVLAKGSELVIEINVEGEPLNLELENALVTVMLDAFTTLENQPVSMDRSTKSGRYEPGQTLRIVIALERAIVDSKTLAVTIELGSLSIVIPPV